MEDNSLEAITRKFKLHSDWKTSAHPTNRYLILSKVRQKERNQRSKSPLPLHAAHYWYDEPLTTHGHLSDRTFWRHLFILWLLSPGARLQWSCASPTPVSMAARVRALTTSATSATVAVVTKATTVNSTSVSRPAGASVTSGSTDTASVLGTTLSSELSYGCASQQCL